MSIRAHRIIKIKLAENPSFVLWDNSKLIQYLEENTDFLDSLNSDGTGQAEVPVAILKKAIRLSKQLEIDGKAKKFLQQDISFAESKGENCVVYDCF